MLSYQFGSFVLFWVHQSDCLQSVHLNAGVTSDLIQNCVDFLEEQRTEVECNKYIDESKHIVDEFGLSQNVLPCQICQQTRVPSHLQTDMIVTEPISQGRSEAWTLNDFMRIDIYLSYHRHCFY
jgi:hypothetical protein